MPQCPPRVGCGGLWGGVVRSRRGRRVVGLGVAAVLVSGDVEGAGVVAEVLVGVGAGPQVGAGFEDVVAPAAVGLEPVVSSAQGCDLAGAGGSALAERDGVVVVAGVFVGSEPAGGSAAPGEDAGDCPEGDGFGDPVGDFVGLDRDVLGEVDDGFDGDLQVGAADPVADGLGADGSAGVLHPPDLGAPGACGAADGGLGQVNVEDDVPAHGLPGCRGAGLLCRLLGRLVGGLVGGVVEGEVAAGDVAEGGGAALVEGLGVAEVADALGFGADGVVEVEGVEVVDLAGDRAGAGDADAMVVDGEVGLVPGGAAAFFGLFGHVPGDGFLEEPVDLAGPDLVGDRGEVPVDVPGGLHREVRGLVGDAAGFPGG